MNPKSDRLLWIAIGIIIAVVVFFLLLLAEKALALDMYAAEKFDSICIAYKESRCINLQGAYHVETFNGKDTLHVVVPDPALYPSENTPAKKHII